MLATGRKRAKASKGFSLIEILVAVCLVGMLVGIALPSMKSVLGLNVKRDANQMQGLIREVYALAAFSGKTHRLVIDLTKNDFVVQVTQGQVSLSEKGQKVDASGEGHLLSEQESDLKKRLGDEAKSKNFLLTPDFSPVQGDLGKKHKLLSGVIFKRVWAEHLTEPISKGEVAIYFFPGGYMQKAKITLSKENGKDALTVVTQPLTGKSVIKEGDAD